MTTHKLENQSGKIHTILIISDDKEMTSVWETLFEQKDCRFFSESSARTGLQTACLLTPSLIVLNLDLPEDERLELCKNLRAATDGTLLLLASKNNLGEFTNYQYAGVDEFISTPISPMAFFIKAMAWMARQEWFLTNPLPARAYA